VPSRRALLIAAAVLAVLAVLWVVIEPIGKGDLLFSVSRDHGLDSDDLPAVGLLVLAGAAAVCSRRRT
jgi:MYXO-CTERM domain-containing protein